MSEAYIGEIRMFAGDYAPQDWAPCDGRLLEIVSNQALFSLLGTTYGGNGTTTFGLPDLRGRVPLCRGANPQTSTNFNLGVAGGAEQVVLTTNHLPAHNHPVSVQSGPGNSQSPANNVWATVAGTNQYTTAAPTGGMNTSAIVAEGGGQGHENLMPYQCVNFIIALAGLYPTQD